MVAGIGDLIIAIKADVDDFHKGMATARETMGALEVTSQRVGRTMRRMGTIMTAAGAVGGVAIAGLVNETNRLDSAFREVNTLLESGKDAQTEFADAARRISEEFAVQGGQLQVIKGLYQTISAGITETGEATLFMESAARLAAVGLTDMETSVDVLTTALNAYGLEANQTAHISNLLFGTVKRGKVRLEELASALPPLISFSAQFGVSMEEVAAGMALMTRNGFSARRAARALRSTIRKFMKPTAAMKTVLREVADEHINMSEGAREAKEALEQEQRKLSDLKGAYQDVQSQLDQYNQKIDDNRTRMQDIQALTRAEAEEVRQLKFDIRDTTEALRDMSGEMDNLSDSMRDNRIAIKEIRLQARKEGRELTEAEKKQIEELEIANDELTLQQMKLQKEMDNTRDKREEQRHQMEEIQQLSESEAKAINDLKFENKELKEEINQLNDEEETLSERISDQEGVVETAEGQWDTYAEQLGTTLLEQKGLGESLRILEEAANDMNIPMTEVIGNQRALQAVFPMLNDDMSEYNDHLQYMEEGGADVAEIFENRVRPSMGSNFQDAINSTRNLLADIGEQFKKGVTPMLKDFNELLDNLHRTWTSLDKPMQNAIAQFVILGSVLALVMGPLLILLGTIITVVGALGTGLLPIIAVVAGGVALLAAAFIDLQHGGENVDDTIQALADAFDKLKETAKKLWDLFKKNLLPALKDLGGAIKEVLGEIGDLVGDMADTTNESEELWDALDKITEVMGDLISKTADFISNNKELISKLVLVATAAGAVYKVLGTLSALASGGGIIGGFVSSISSLAATLSGASISGTIAGISLSVSGLTLSVVGLIAALIALALYITNFGGFADLVDNIAAGTKEAIGGIIEFIKEDVIAPLENEIMSQWEENFGELEKEVDETVDAVIGFFEMLEPYFAVLVDLVDWAVGGMVDLWDEWGDEIRSTVAFVVDQIIGTMGWMMDTIFFIIALILNIIQLDWEGAWNTIKDYLTDTLDGIINFIDKWDVVGVLKDIGKGIVKAVIKFAKDVKEAGEDMWDDIVQGAEDLKDDIINGVTDAIDNTVSYLKEDAVGDLKQAGLIAIGGLLKAFNNIFGGGDGGEGGKSPVQQVKDVINDVTEWLSKPAEEKLYDIGYAAGKVLRTALIAGFNTLMDLKDKVEEAINSVVTYFTSGQWKKDLKSAWDSMEQWVDQRIEEIFAFGERVKEQVIEAVTYLKEEAVTQIKNAIDWANDVKEQAKKTFKELLKQAKQAILDVKEYFVSGQAWRDLKSGVVSVVTKIGDAWKQLKKDVMKWVRQTIQDVKTFFLEDAPRMIKSAVEKLIDVIKAPFEGFYDALIGNSLIPEMFRDIRDWILNNAIPMLKTAFNNLVDGLKKLVSDGFDKLVSNVERTIDGWISGMKTKFNNFEGKAKTIFKRLWNDLKKKVKNWARDFRQRISKWSNKIKKEFNKWKRKVNNVVKNAFRDLKTKVKNWIKNWKRKIQNWVKDTVKKFQEARRKMKEKIQNTIDEIITKIKNWNFEKEIQKVIDGVIQIFQDLYNDLIGGSIIPDLLSDIISAVTSWRFEEEIQGILDSVISAAETFASDMLTEMNNMISDIASYFRGAAKRTVKSAFKSLRTGIENVLAAIDLTGISDALDDIIQAAKDAYDWITDVGNYDLTIDWPEPPKIVKKAFNGNLSIDWPSAPSGNSNSGSSSSGSSGSSSSGSSSSGGGSGYIPRGASRAMSGMGVGFAHGGIVTGPTLGMVGEGRHDEAIMPLPDVKELIGMAMGMGAPMGVGGPQGAKIESKNETIIEEGALKIEEGAFEGVSEEELPEKVGEEVEGKLGDIVDDLRGRGQ